MEAPKKPVIVRKVFASELDYEFLLIQRAIVDYPFVSMDTEFPGTIFKPRKEIIQLAKPVFNYQYMKANVDALNIIQLGLTLSDSQGNLPDFNTDFCYIWEFNFKDFDIHRDYCDKNSIELLKRQGIDFLKNRSKGIPSSYFGMILSDFLFDYFEDLTWISFHSAYDFGFLLKIMTQQPLPNDVNSFIEQLAYYFGENVFDIKHTFKFFGLLGGLEKVANKLNVSRIAGLTHQAGSDSLVTLQCFMELKKLKGFECNSNQLMLPSLALYGLVQTI